MHTITGLTDAQVLDWERLLIEAVNAAMVKVCNQVAADLGRDRVVAAAGPLPPGQAFVSVDDLGKIPAAWRDELDRAIMPIVGDVYLDSAGAVHTKFVKLIGDQIPGIGSADAEAYLASAVNRWEYVGDGLWNAARTELLDGFQAGESIPELQARVRKAADVSRKQAEAIARTEVIAASNSGSMATARVSGLEMVKVWLATEDARTRPTHRTADGQRRPLAAPFDVGGHSLDFPGDPGGAPEEVHNCRCTVTYDIPDDEAERGIEEQADRAITRQADIDAARPAGDIAAQFAEQERRLLDNEVGADELGQALGERVGNLASAARANLRPGGRLPEGLDAVETAARRGDADQIRAAIDEMMRRNNVSLQGRAYDRVEFDRSTQKLLADDGRTGGEVTIIRPRSVLQRDGETIELSKAVVADIPAAEVQAARERIARTLAAHRGEVIPDRLAEQARLRQVDIDAARAVSEVSAEVDELLANMGDRIDWDVLTRGIKTTAKRTGLDVETRDRLLGQIGNPDGLRRLADQLAADAGLTPLGRAGDIVAYDSKIHQAIEGVRLRPGQLAEVVRRGHTYRRGDEDIRLAKAMVDEAPPGARLTPRTEPAAPVVDAYAGRQAAVRALVEQDPTDTRRLGGSIAQTELLSYEDDQKLIRKVYGPRQRESAAEIKRETDAETLGALVLDRLGVRAAGTVSPERGKLFIEYLDGATGSELGYAREIPDWILDSDDGVRMGLADLLMLNIDRNSGNWLLQEGNRLAGIDHGYAFAHRVSLANAVKNFPFPFARFAMDQVDGRDVLAAQIRLPAGINLARIRLELEALRGAFEELGRGTWHRGMMDRLTEIERRVK